MTQSRSTNKFLVFIIFLLLITNILVVGYFLFFSKKKHKKDAKPKDFAGVLQKEVGFDEKQVAQFNEFKKSHWADAKTKMDQIVAIKNAIFDLSAKETPDSVVEKLADSIGDLQKQVEISAFKHVVGTRKICTPQQRPAYDSLMRKIINRGRPGHPPGSGSPEKKS